MVTEDFFVRQQHEANESLSSCIFQCPWLLRLPGIWAEGRRGEPSQNSGRWLSARVGKAGQVMSKPIHAIVRTLAIALPLVLSGCLADRPDAKRPDPLTGLPPRIPADQREVSSTYRPNDRSTPAVVAAAGPKAPGDMSNLSIRDRGPEQDRGTVNPTGAWSGLESKSGSAMPTGGARLGNARAPGMVEPPSNMTGGLRVRSFEEAQQFLMARGVKWQNLQTTGEGEWKFSCSIPNKSGSNSMRTYEASDRWGLLAMQKVIDQILRDQSR